MASPSFYTKTTFYGECQGCGKIFSSANAMGVVARHFEKCGGYISLDATRTFVWEPKQPARGAV